MLGPPLRGWAQTHLLRCWDRLSEDGRHRLAEQILAVDWARIADWARDYVLSPPAAAAETPPVPAPYMPAQPTTAERQALYREAEATGEEMLRTGRIAGFTVAGGQGTRLGYDAPKGTFRITPVRKQSLFGVFAESVLGARERYGAPIPWYIMTSPINHDATCAYLRENDYFGLAPDSVRCFQQGTLPAVDLEGKALLAAPDSLALSPDGHGGSLLALRRSGALDEMRKAGIDTISYWQVDNPLVCTFDPLFLGLHALQGSDMSSRSLTKLSPGEKLGVFCMVDDSLRIVEYSDLPDRLANERDENGCLRFRAGSPAIHIISRAFVERLTLDGLQLPVHRADKNVPFLNAEGELVNPDEPNAVKFEMFVFDALAVANRSLILEALREEQFAPVKNAEGSDSPESCRDLLWARAARWLEQADAADVQWDAEGQPDLRVELSPRTFRDANDVATRAGDLELPPAGEERYIE